jgi:sterol desaturase/sphingolipid hydroxylase (fatty acid hydroxylase superfamily)
MEAGHFLLGVQLGYGAAWLACLGIAHYVQFAYWPASWPIAVQLLLAVVVYEGTSYWQHRYFHRSRRFWGFHALHHAGPSLNILRGLRFHAVDIAVPTFMGYLPLLVLGAPSSVIVILNVVISAFGITQHANVRMRTPKWLDAIVCTPVLHRRHHALSREESACNYGTTVMIWDRLFGTFRYGKTPDGPEAIGIENDDVPRTFWKQILVPFKRA